MFGWVLIALLLLGLLDPIVALIVYVSHRQLPVSAT